MKPEGPPETLLLPPGLQNWSPLGGNKNKSYIYLVFTTCRANKYLTDIISCDLAITRYELPSFPRWGKGGTREGKWFLKATSKELSSSHVELEVPVGHLSGRVPYIHRSTIHTHTHTRVWKILPPYTILHFKCHHVWTGIWTVQNSNLSEADEWVS